MPSELRKTEQGPMKRFKFKRPDGSTGSVPFLENPYDDLAKDYKRRIEEYYKVEITDDEVWWGVIEPALASPIGINPSMSSSVLYYAFFEVNFVLSLLKTPPPESIEADNLMYWPIKAWFMSQNVLLVHLIEVYARNKALDHYVADMIGAKEKEEEILKRVEAEFAPKAPEKRQGLKRFVSRVNRGGSRINKALDRFVHVFVKRGPYEIIFYERISKMFARGMGGYYGQQIGFVQGKMGVK
jgi:hypothetical protein